MYLENVIKYLLLSCFFIVLSKSNLIQSQKFPSDKKKFTKYIDKLFSNLDNENQKEFIKKTFPNKINNDIDFNDKYYTKMIDMCNELQSQRFKSYPVIYNYLKCVYWHSEKINSSNEYINWENVLKAHFEKKYKNDTYPFIVFSRYFFKYQLINSTQNVNWYCKKGNYSFEFKKQAVINVKKTNLKCQYSNKLSGINSYDSIVVYNTNGIYLIKSKFWKGENGTITWEKVGLSKRATKAELNNYILSTKSSKLNADSVRLYMPYFKKPIYGRITDKADLFLREIDRVYPTFASYEKRISIPKIFNGIDYNGGFLVKGKTLAGYGDEENLAVLIVQKQNKDFITAKSTYFGITNSGISSKKCAVKIAIDNAFITHNGLNFSYSKKQNSIELARPFKGLGTTPFENFYHMIDMTPSRIIYKMGDSKLKLTYPFRCTDDLKIANFESKNFFDGRLFDRFKGYEKINPLIRISSYVKESKSQIFNIGEISNQLNKTINQAKPLLIEMATYGFVIYDTKRGEITIKKKLLNYVDYKMKMKDYDEISFESDLSPKKIMPLSNEQRSDSTKLKEYKKNKAKIENRNRLKNFGEIDLNTFELKINGIDQLTISNHHKCWIYPENATITILKNREIDFNGWVVSGKMETKTFVSSYSYEKNKIFLDECAFSFFRVNPLNEQDGKKEIAMKSDIIGLTGEIIVSDTNNRSGIFYESMEFPKLSSSKNSYVYYNNILKGAYDTSRFYFLIKPFNLDSLSNFDEKKLQMHGELISAGIFPKITDPLVIMNDYSFGFIVESSEKGLPFYGNKAKYYNKIALSNNGLQGSGVINYCEATAKSNIYTFLPDSTIGYADFVNKPKENGIEYPDVECKKAFITYLPKKELLKAKSTHKTPLKFFENEAQLFGSLEISKNGMTGRGDFGFKTAFMNSKKYTFNRWCIKADSSNFNLKNTYGKEGDDPLALSANDVRANISFKERQGQFNSDQTQEIKFPSNLYYCLMDKFIWEMDGSTVNMQKEDEKTSFETEGVGEKSNFFSYHPNQENLNFKALQAQYDLKSQKISCKKVNYIPVGDVRIFPNQNMVVIQKKAVLEELKNAKIKTLSKTHNFAECNLNIKSKSEYHGKGKYQYYDIDSNVTSIYMNEINCVNSNTKASGEIKEKNRFKLNKHFEYFGDITIISTNPGIYCEGSTKLIHTCKNFSKDWMSFKDTIIAKNVIIPFDENTLNIKGEKISAGFAWRESKDIDSIKIYPTFLSKIEKENDPVLFSSTGYIVFNENKDEFQISSKNALNDRSNSSLNLLAVSTDNFLSLHTKSCSLSGEGEISLGMNYGPVKMKSFGKIDYNQNSKKTSLNLSLRIDIPLDRKIMESLANKIKLEDQFRLMKLKSSNFDRAMMHWAGEKTTNKIIESFIEDSKAPKFPSEFENTLFLSGLKLISFDEKSKEEKGLISNSRNAQVISIYKKPIMKSVPIRIFWEQLFKEKSGDKFGLEFLLPNDKKYFFHYEMEKKNGEMLIETSDENFKNSINELKSDKRKDKNFKYKTTEEKIYFTLFNELFKQ